MVEPRRFSKIYQFSQIKNRVQPTYYFFCHDCRPLNHSDVPNARNFGERQYSKWLLGVNTCFSCMEICLRGFFVTHISNFVFLFRKIYS